MRIFALLTYSASGSYLDLKMSEVSRFEHTPHPIEFEDVLLSMMRDPGSLRTSEIGSSTIKSWFLLALGNSGRSTRDRLIDQTVGVPYAALFPHKGLGIATAAAVVDPDDATGTHQAVSQEALARTLHVTPPQRSKCSSNQRQLHHFPANRWGRRAICRGIICRRRCGQLWF
jgi:hypothetical protein